MSEPEKPAKAGDEESGELSQDQLDEVSGGIIIINSRSSPGGASGQSSNDGSLLGWATFPNWQSTTDGKTLSEE